MKRVAFVLLLLAAFATSALLLLEPGAQASPDVTMTVDSTADSNDRNSVLTLREAMLLANGDLQIVNVSQEECDNISGGWWRVANPSHCDANIAPGFFSSDAVVFSPGVFPPASPATIALSSTLPDLDTDNDTVDGSGAGVAVQGANFPCFRVLSDNNTIKRLRIHQCSTGVLVNGRNNTVAGNYIGVDASGDAEGNDDGIGITGGAENVIDRNMISGNGTGVTITGGEGNILAGNYIGTNATGDAPIPNSTGVVLRLFGQNNTIGDTTAGMGNLVAYNWIGIRVEGDGATGNTIRGNSIHSNGFMGIQNFGGGNGELTPPVITGFGSVMGTACAGCTIDIYSDDEDEGREYEGSTAADAAGN